MVSGPARRAARAALLVLLAIAVVASAAEVRPVAALAELGLGGAKPVPALPEAWADVATARPVGAPARAALRVIAREQRTGVLRQVLGTRPARVVQVGPLQDHGVTVGVTALLALPVPRHHVSTPTFTASTLRDLLVNVDLRGPGTMSFEPGPASRTSAWRLGLSAARAAALAAAPATPPLVRLSPGGPSFAPDDGTQAPGGTGRDWPVSLVFAGHATIAKVKRALRSVGLTHTGERRWLAYRVAAGRLRFDGDSGLKSACDANGADVHLRLYAPTAAGHFSDPRYGHVVVATAHLDRGEACSTPPRVFGFSEEAERRVADLVAHGLGWRVQRDRIALHNAEPYRRDLAAPDHVWWSNGRATLISVP